jgi:uncharacterized membrane protein (Fun14 family)
MAILPFSNVLGGSLVSKPLNFYAGAYVPSLGKFVGAVAGVATLTISGVTVNGAIDANGNFVPAISSQFPQTSGSFAATLVAVADTSTVFINLVSQVTPCGLSTIQSSTQVVADRYNATIIDRTGNKQRVLIILDKFATNAAALAAGLIVGDQYLDSTNTIKVVV